MKEDLTDKPPIDEIFPIILVGVIVFAFIVCFAIVGKTIYLKIIGHSTPTVSAQQIK